MASTASLVLKITGDVSDATEQLGGLSGTVGKAAKVAGAALVGVGVAVGAMAVKGVAEFAKFEKGMNEVFTLLPGISADAMGKMEDQVLALSTQMGILPEEVVPALYQSLSAGVYLCWRGEVSKGIFGNYFLAFCGTKELFGSLHLSTHSGCGTLF